MVKLLIAVGGTGQHVAHAYLKMASVAGMDPSDLPNIFIVDADVKKSMSGSNGGELFENISELHARLTSTIPEPNRPILAQVSPYEIQDGKSVKFRSILSDHQHDNEKYNLVIEALFTPEEREMQLDMGMCASPNVGASAMKMALAGNNSRGNNPSLDLLKKIINNAKESTIAVVGSSFGGTGSGGVPTFTFMAANAALSDQDETPNRKRFVRMYSILPWFDITPEDPLIGLKTWATDERRKANASGGLRYYSGKLDNVSAVFASYPHIWEASVKDNGNTKQKENHHIFNLFIAASVQRFFFDPKSLEPWHYTFAAKVRKDDVTTKKQIVENTNLLNFPIANQAGGSHLLDHLERTQALRILMESLLGLMNSGFTPKGFSFRGPIPKGLRQVAIKLAGYLKEFAKDDPKKEAPPSVYSAIAEKLRDHLAELSEDIKWFGDVNASTTEGYKIPEHLVAKEFSSELKSDLIGTAKESVLARRIFNILNDSQGILTDIDAQIKDSANPDKIKTAGAVILTKFLRTGIAEQLPKWRSVIAEKHETEDGAPDVQVFLPADLQITPTPGEGEKKIPEKISSAFNQSQQAGSFSIHELSYHGFPTPWAAVNYTSENQKGVNPEEVQAKARRNLEAILWGIMTNSLIVEEISYKALGRLGTMLFTSMQEEMPKNPINNDDPLEVAYFLNGRKKIVIACSHPDCWWSLAPSAMRGNTPWWEREETKLTYELPSEQKFGQGSFEYNKAKEFMNKLSEIKLDTEAEIQNSGLKWQPSWLPIVGLLIRNLKEYYR